MNKNQKRNGKDHGNFQRVWSEEKIFKHPLLPIGVKLTKSNDRFPLFRQELVEIAEDGKTFSRMKVMSTGHRTGQIQVPDISNAIASVFDQAREYILEKLIAAEDEWIEFSKGREDNGPKKPMGIKSLGRRDKERRQRRQRQQEG